MTTRKQPDSKSAEQPRSISGEANSWIGEFVAVLEHNFGNAVEGLPAGAKSSEYHIQTVLAFLQAFEHFGVNEETLWEMIGSVSVRRTPATEWNSELNARRFELIDKELQGTLSHKERVELASLTARMRLHVDTELNVPMEGVQKLYASLSDPPVSDDSH